MLVSLDLVMLTSSDSFILFSKLHSPNTSRHILIKLSKIKYKEKILKAAREKQQITHKVIPIR